MGGEVPLATMILVSFPLLAAYPIYLTPALSAEIQQYVDEITVGLTESNTDNEESEVCHETQPAEDDTRSQPSASTTSALHGNVRQASSPGISLKRSISEGESVVEEDEKPAKVECIDLTD